MGEDEKRGGSVKTFRVLELEGAKPFSMCSCFYVRGQNLRPVFEQIVDNVCKRNRIDTVELGRRITARLGCEETTIPKYLANKDQFPVYLLNLLLERIPESLRESYSAKIQKEAEMFKFGKSERWAQFPKRLSRELAWLAGAVVADGWIHKSQCGKERLGIVDQNRSPLAIAVTYFARVFGVTPTLKKHKTENCWVLTVDCKAISRFFTVFLGFGYGPKARIASEPPILKKSHYRLDFAKGVLSFDGSVELDSTVSLGVKSKALILSIYEILIDNGFEVKCPSYRAKAFFIRSKYLSELNDGRRWVSLFGVGTPKGNRLNFLIHGSEVPPISEAEAANTLEKFVRKRSTSKISISSLLEFAAARQKFTKHEAMGRFGIGYSTFWKYALILRRAGILSRDGKTGRNARSYYTFNPNMASWRMPLTVS